MLLALLMADQMAVASAIQFDLRNFRPETSCESDTGRPDEIVVCAPGDSLERFRLRRLPSDKFEQKPIRAETGLIGRVKVATEVEQETMTDGTISNRLMVRLKVPF